MAALATCAEQIQVITGYLGEVGVATAAALYS